MRNGMVDAGAGPDFEPHRGTSNVARRGLHCDAYSQYTHLHQSSSPIILTLQLVAVDCARLLPALYVRLSGCGKRSQPSGGMRSNFPNFVLPYFSAASVIFRLRDRAPRGGISLPFAKLIHRAFYAGAAGLGRTQLGAGLGGGSCGLVLATQKLVGEQKVGTWKHGCLRGSARYLSWHAADQTTSGIYWRTRHLAGRNSRVRHAGIAKVENQAGRWASRIPEPIEGTSVLRAEDEDSIQAIENDNSRRKDSMILRIATIHKDGSVSVWRTVIINKIEFCREHGLLSRDLRKIDVNSPDHKIPSILVRSKSILVNVLKYRILIKPNVAIIIESPTNEKYTDGLLRDLSEKISSQSGDPFELKMLEGILNDVTNKLLWSQRMMLQRSNRVLQKLDEEIGEEELRNLLEAIRALMAFNHSVRAIESVLEEILDNEDDLALLYITRNQEPSKTHDHTEAELMLEHYLSLVGGISQNNLVSISDLDNTKIMINSVLDSRRNDIMRCSLLIALWSLAISTGTLLAGVFGMNLLSGVESKDGFFYYVAFAVFFLPMSLYLLGLIRMKKFLSFSMSKKKIKSLVRDRYHLK